MPSALVGTSRKASFSVDVIICSAFFCPSSFITFVFFSSLLHTLFSVCACSFSPVQPWIPWTISTENVSGLHSQISDKHEDRTVGCISLSSTVSWKATPASQWPQWSLLPETEECVCVSWRSGSWQEKAELLYLTGRRQGEDGRNGRVLPKFRGVSFLLTNFLFSSFQSLQSFPAWRQKLICERQK